MAGNVSTRECAAGSIETELRVSGAVQPRSRPRTERPANHVPREFVPPTIEERHLTAAVKTRDEIVISLKRDDRGDAMEMVVVKKEARPLLGMLHPRLPAPVAARQLRSRRRLRNIGRPGAEEPPTGSPRPGHGPQTSGRSRRRRRRRRAGEGCTPTTLPALEGLRPTGKRPAARSPPNALGEGVDPSEGGTPGRSARGVDGS